MYTWGERNQKIAERIAFESVTKHLHHKEITSKIHSYFGNRQSDNIYEADYLTNEELGQDVWVNYDEVVVLLALVNHSMFNTSPWEYVCKDTILITCEMVDLLTMIRSEPWNFNDQNLLFDSGLFCW